MGDTGDTGDTGDSHQAKMSNDLARESSRMKVWGGTAGREPTERRVCGYRLFALSVGFE